MSSPVRSSDEAPRPRVTHLRCPRCQHYHRRPDGWYDRCPECRVDDPTTDGCWITVIDG